MTQSVITSEEDSVIKERASTIEEEETTDMEMVTHWIIYDASRGDTTTKKPPILAEGRTERRSRSASRREVEANDTEKGATSRHIEWETTRQTDIETEEHQEVKAEPIGSNVPAILFVVAVGVFVVYFVYRKKE